MSEDHLEKSKDFVQSLDRGLSIFKVFNANHPRLTLSEVAELTGFTRATARRFLMTLEGLNYVGRFERYFFLKPRVLELGYAYLSSFSLVSIAQGHLEELADEVKESASATVLEGTNVIYVCRAAAKRIMTINLAVGTQLPAYATSMGRVLLASMSSAELDRYFQNTELEKLTSKTITNEKELRSIIRKVREQGYSIVCEELEDGVQSVSIPIRGKDGKVLAAANVSAHSSRVSEGDLREKFLPKLRKCISQIEKDLSLQN
jgi:IclR family pca regulon transcriptional regulator